MSFNNILFEQLPACPQTGALSVPIYQTSTFQQEQPGVHKGYDYSRSNNPTRHSLEKILAALEHGAGACAFSSGLAAIDATLKLLRSGDEIVAVDDIYGGAYRLFTHVFQKFGIKVTYVDTADAIEVARAITPKTRFVWLESPTNPTLKISNIGAISDIAHHHNVLVVVDNTFASPVAQQPLKLGADIVIHSATKYLAGHSDVIAGAVICKDPELAAEIKFIQNASGAVLSPFDSWLTIRGIQTLELRVQRHSENALRVARFLEQHPDVEAVHYPGLKSHPNHTVARLQQKYFGGVVSFSLKDDQFDLAESLVCSTSTFKLAESLGGTRSLICHPAQMTHKSTPPEVRQKAGIKDSLIRLSCGIEDADDLIADLVSAFEKAQQAKLVQPQIAWK